MRRKRLKENKNVFWNKISAEMRFAVCKLFWISRNHFTDIPIENSTQARSQDLEKGGGLF